MLRALCVYTEAAFDVNALEGAPHFLTIQLPALPLTPAKEPLVVLLQQRGRMCHFCQAAVSAEENGLAQFTCGGFRGKSVGKQACGIGKRGPAGQVESDADDR